MNERCWIEYLVLNNNSSNHFALCNVERIPTLVYKQMNFNSFKNEITFKLFSWNHIHKNVCKQMPDVKLLLWHCKDWNNLTLGKQIIYRK